MIWIEGQAKKTLAHILDRKRNRAAMSFEPSDEARSDRRRQLPFE